VQGRRKGLDGGARGLDVVGIGIGVAGAGGSGFGHGCSLGFLEDVLVESGESWSSVRRESGGMA
jgi:hypothetical protein